jgi:hypothetical protein
MSDKTAVRVESDPLPSSEGGNDYASLLEENIALLRRVDEFQGKVTEAKTETVKAVEAKQQAEKELLEYKEKHKLPSGYRGIRRKIIWLNIMVAVAVMFLPTLIWYKNQTVFHPGFCAIGLGGIVWMIVTCVWLDGLADNEQRYG